LGLAQKVSGEFNFGLISP